MTTKFSQWLGSLPISESAKLLLFGIPSPKPLTIPKAASTPDESIRRNNFQEIEERLEAWLQSPGSTSVDLSLEDLAERIGISRRRLLSFFQFHLGKNYRTWKSEIKMEKAKEMLLSGDYETVTDVAIALGFRDSANLHRLFRRVVGCTPLEWKASCGHPMTT